MCGGGGWGWWVVLVGVGGELWWWVVAVVVGGGGGWWWLLRESLVFTFGPKPQLKFGPSWTTIILCYFSENSNLRTSLE